jgi:putative DNA methylase
MGWLEAKRSKVRLLKREELATEWLPKQTESVTVWEAMQRMIHALLNEQGEESAATILRATGAVGEMARDLAYRLYTVCERKGWTQEALAYNGLVTSWPRISQTARRESPDSHLYQASFL